MAAEETNADAAMAVEERRLSIEKKPLKVSAVERLPDEIIQQILQATDPDSFASLILLNSKWRRVSQETHLYALQLSRCPSYAASHVSISQKTLSAPDALARLRRLFAQEIKRNIFSAYLRPSETVIRLVNNSISSSSCPGGEGMQFSPSPRGHHILAYNSSRIYVIDVRGEHISVKRELKILRRPVSTCIKDDGKLLAVLSTEMQVDLYDMRETPPKRTQSMILDHTPRTIALSPCGSVLAAAYEGGIEVSSLNPGALPTDRRSVKCDGVDSLAFSFDGTQLLGTTVNSALPSTVILTAPYYDPGNLMADDNISPLWTTSILFPNTSRDCSHAVLLQNSSQEEASWTFTYDRSFETFRAVRIDDLRNGTTYFTGPVPSPNSQAKLLPCTLPSASYHGELVSAGFQGKEIWVYGVPEDLDAVPEASAAEAGPNGLARRNSGLSRSNSRPQESERVPQWQLLVDKLRNAFVGGCKVAELDGVKTVKWISDFGKFSMQERLVIAARGLSAAIVEEDDIDFVDGGRITLLDFDFGTTNGVKREITMEVGTEDAEVLEEEQRDLEADVAIVRRRTVVQRRGDRNSLLRAATTASRPPPLPRTSSSPSRVPTTSISEEDDDPLVPRRVRMAPATSEPEAPTSPEGETSSLIDEAEALDLPYSHASPRSGTTLRRAATAAAANRQRHPQPAAAGHIEYRRADGRREHPHESDADNWVPPPPPYQKDDPGDLPAFLRNAILGEGSSQGQGDFNAQSTAPIVTIFPPQQPQPHMQPHTLPDRRLESQTSPPEQTSVAPPPMPPLPASHAQGPRQRLSSIPRDSHQRSISLTSEISRLQSDETPPRPASSSSAMPGNWAGYDVSPPDSPRQGNATASSPDAVSPSEQSAAVTTLPPPQTDVQTSAQTGSSGAVNSIAGGLTSTGQETQQSQDQSRPKQQLPLTSPRLLAPQQPLPPEAASRIQEAQRNPPLLDTTIPSPSMSTIHWSAVGQSTPSATEPSAGPMPRRLSNAQTWPLAPKPDANANLNTGYPNTAPTSAAVEPPSNHNFSNSALPPLPRADQLASLRNRTSGPPRRLSGAFQGPRAPIAAAGRSNTEPLTIHAPQPSFTQNRRSSSSHGQIPPQPDTPLIISTPTGVSGAFDPPNRQLSTHRPDPPIFAPVPRRNTPGANPRPTVERLETIYSVASVEATRGESRQRRFFGGFLSRESSNDVSGHSRPGNTVTRKKSKAQRRARRGEKGKQGGVSGSGGVVVGQSATWGPQRNEGMVSAGSGSMFGTRAEPPRDTERGDKCAVM